MEAKIVKGQLALTGKLDTPRPSSSGKTLVCLTGNLKVAGDDGHVYTVAFNVYRKPDVVS